MGLLVIKYVSEDEYLIRIDPSQNEENEFIMLLKML